VKRSTKTMFLCHQCQTTLVLEKPGGRESLNEYCLMTVCGGCETKRRLRCFHPTCILDSLPLAPKCFKTSKSAEQHYNPNLRSYKDHSFDPNHPPPLGDDTSAPMAVAFNGSILSTSSAGITIPTRLSGETSGSQSESFPFGGSLSDFDNNEAGEPIPLVVPKWFQYSSKATPESINMLQVNENTKAFFRDTVREPDSGPRKLVARAFSVSCGIIGRNPSIMETAFHLLCSTFANGLTRNQLAVLSSLLCIVVQIMSSDSRDRFVTRFPTSEEDFNEFYLRNRRSIYKAMPQPTTVATSDHSYTSIIEFLEVILGMGVEIEGLDLDVVALDSETQRQVPVSKATQSLAASRIREKLKTTREGIENDTLAIIFSVFSDDFETNSVKQNRKSSKIWLKTVTFRTKTGEHITVLVSLGKSKGDHDIVAKMMASEMKSLEEGRTMYVGGLVQKMVNVVAVPICFILDRPERCADCKISQQSGLFTAAWKVSLPAKLVIDKIPSCGDCLYKRTQRLESNPYPLTKVELDAIAATSRNQACCADWDLLSSALALPLPVDRGVHITLSKYPRRCCIKSPPAPKGREVEIINEDGSRTPQEAILGQVQSFPWILQGFRFAYHNFCCRMWNKGTTEAYLASLGVNAVAQTNFFLAAVMDGVGGPRSSYVEPATVIEVPEHIIPVQWTTHGVDLDMYVDSIMHLYFHGITKSLIKTIHEWLKQ
jgi:hypothetical protein